MTNPNFTRPGAVDLSSLTTAQPATGAAGGGGYVTDITETGFQELVGRSMQYPVIVEFHSPRDTGGAKVSSDLAALVNAAEGRFLLARVNVDTEPRLTQALGVTAVPMVVAIIGGQVMPLFQGTRDRADISAVLDQVAQLAVANGMTGRAQTTGAAAPEEAAVPATDPRFEKADAALAAGDFAQAVVEFDALLAATPGDPEATAGRAQAALLERSASFDGAAIVKAAVERPDDVAAQLDAADLEVIQGEYSSAFDRLLGLAAEVAPDERETIRVRLLELFEVAGRTSPDVLKARRRLTTVLF
ncbi:tetratricopeptide repeat protein [[Pseudopropionibacterium] massiliense]|uniref:tetratricopeptide repeat protein n=1 Tax=[Pseudopropionibacterium] massiliense TaxID=2220000 RepID=UPI0013EF1617|nr:tetratricopeptide repeat protein [[Pseudopropionibacterium] massiliense]